MQTLYVGNKGAAMQAKAVAAILALLTLSSLSWADGTTEKTEHETGQATPGDLVEDFIGGLGDHFSKYKPMDYTEKVRGKLQAAVDAAEKKLPEIEKTKDLLKKSEAKSTWIEDLLTAYFEFSGMKAGKPLERSLNIALPDKPAEDGSKKREIQDTIKGMQAVWTSLTPEQRKIFKGMRAEKGPVASAEDMGKLAYALKTMAATIEEKRNKEGDSKTIAADTRTLKALKALEPLFATKIFAALDKEFKEAKDKDAYVKNQQNKGAWDIAREWAGATPENEVAFAFDPQIKKLADTKAAAAKEKELAKSPVRKTAAEPAALPATDAKPIPKKVQVSFNGPKGNEWVDAVQKEDGLVHVTVNYPAGVYSTPKSVEVVHTYKKDNLPKGLQINQSAPIAVFGSGFNKSFPTVMINNEPYIVTKDGYTHYKFVDFFGSGQRQPPQAPAPAPAAQTAVAAASPAQDSKSSVKVSASVQGKGSVKVEAAVSARGKDPAVASVSVSGDSPTLVSVTIDPETYKGKDSAQVQKDHIESAYEMSVKTARAAMAGQLKDIKWEKGHEPFVINTKGNNPVLIFKGNNNGPELLIGVTKEKDGTLVPVGDCINCNNVNYREAYGRTGIFTDHAIPLPKVLTGKKHDEQDIFPDFDELKPKLQSLTAAVAARTTPVAAAKTSAETLPTTATPIMPVAATMPLFIQPVDVSTVAYGYRGPEAYYNPVQPAQTAQTTGARTASTSTGTTQKRMVRKVVSSYCPRCNGGRGGYIQSYVDVWE